MSHKRQELQGGDAFSPRLLTFCIFNPGISHKEETAHLNILYYYPKSTSLNKQMNDIGLCTAICGVVDRFGTNVEGDEKEKANANRTVITTSFRRYTLRQMEKNFWFLTITSRPVSPLPTEDDSDDRVSDLVDLHMSIAHSIFCMLCGSVTFNYTDERYQQETVEARVTRMRALLQQGISKRLIPTLADALTSPAGSLGVPAGIEYLSVDKHSYLVVSSLVSLIQSAHPSAVKTAVIAYDGKVVYSGLSLFDTFKLFRILAEVSAPTAFSSEGSSPGATISRNIASVIQLLTSSQGISQKNATGYLHTLTGKAESGEDVVAAIPTLYLDDELVGVVTYCVGEFRVYFIIVHKYILHAPLRTGLLDGIEQIMKHDGCPKLQSGITPAVVFSKELDNKYAYFYCNRMNFAIKSSLMQRMQQQNFRDIVQVMDVLRCSLLASGTEHHLLAHADIFTGVDPAEVDHDKGEGPFDILVRIKSNFWISCLRSGKREFLLAIEAASLSEAIEQINFVSKYVFVGIFLG